MLYQVVLLSSLVCFRLLPRPGVPLPPPEAGVQGFECARCFHFIGTQPATLDPEVLEHLCSREDHAEHYETEWRWGEPPTS